MADATIKAIATCMTYHEEKLAVICPGFTPGVNIRTERHNAGDVFTTPKGQADTLIAMGLAELWDSGLFGARR